MDQNQLFEEIQNKRDCGEVHLAVFDRTEGISWKEDLTLKTLEANIFSWNGIIFYRKKQKSAREHPISGEEVDKVLNPIKTSEKAVLILAHLLHRDMAYEEELIPELEAHELASRFVALFNKEKTDYFSNSSWNEKENSPFGIGLNSWGNLTNATFDSGIIIIDEDKIGIAWFEDED